MRACGGLGAGATSSTRIGGAGRRHVVTKVLTYIALCSDGRYGFQLKPWNISSPMDLEEACASLSVEGAKTGKGAGSEDVE